ncbi:MAG: OmpA family protein [Pseudomonadales bacterium]
MKFNKLKWTLGALALAVTGITNPAAAADSSGWYLGAGVGQSRATIAHKQIRDDLLASGFTTTDFDMDEEDFSYKLFAGYQFNRNFALEAGYFDLGEFDYTATTVPTGTKTGELEFQGWNFDLVGTIPLSERAGVFGRIGVHRSEAEVQFAGTGAVNVLQPRFSETATKFKAGIGFQYRMTDSLALRVEAERYRMDDAVGNDGDLDLLSASLVYQFQRPAPAPAPRAERPAEPVPAAQEVVVVPLPVATEQYCSLLDIQFEIDQDKIQREEEEKLAVVATFLQRYPNTGAVIEGHTDNVGSAASNLQLSQRRAESVVDYLVREHGIERSRLQAEGYGETRPIADNSTQEGQRANRRIATIIGCATDIAGLEPLPARMTLAMEMEFDRNSAAIKPQYDDQLRNFAKFLAANPSLTATMEGHADNASPDMAQRISRERAQSVANYLVEQFGVDRSRLSVQGYGETRRFAYNISEEGRQQNRRVNIILDYKD